MNKSISLEAAVVRVAGRLLGFLLGAFLICILASAYNKAHAADDRMSHSSPGAAFPISAVAVVSCGRVVATFVTYADGRFIVLDAAHHEGFDDTDKVKSLIESATNQRVLDIGCVEAQKS